MRTGSGSKIRLALATTTALTLAIPPNFGIPPSGGGGGGPLSIQDFPRDYLIYDSGGAAGLSFASVPVSGTGPVGATIQARAVSTALSDIGTTAWATIATVGAGGTYLGLLDVPLARPWLKIEVRNAVAPVTVVQTTNRFAVGIVAAKWGQSEPFRCTDPNIDTLAMPALVTIKQQVLNLANPGMSGRTSRNPLNVAAPGNLPPGGSLSGNVISINGTQTIADWSFTNYEVRFPSGSNVALRQCQFIGTDAGTNFWMTNALVGGRATIDDCDFIGPLSSTGLAGAIKEEQTAIGQYGRIITTRSKFIGLPSDGFKLVAGSIRWCYGHWSRNTDTTGPIPAWVSGTSYAVGDHVYSAQGDVFRSLTNGNLNNTPPTTKSSDAFWQNIDMHVDCITVEKSEEPVFIEYSYFTMRDLTFANGGTGPVNNVRFAPNSGTSAFLNCHVRYCVFDRDPNANSQPFQITDSFLGQVYFTGCWYTPRGFGGNRDIYPSNQTAYRWAGMKDLATDAARPAIEGQIDESATFIEENNDYVIQHVYHNRSPVGTGAAGVQYRPMTAASGHTSSFRAMANVTLLELCGYKVCYLHQTQSGTGTGDLFSDADTSRYWIDDKAIHDFATAGGGSVGIAGAAWNSSTIQQREFISISFYELLTRKNWTTGATMALPFIYPSNGPAGSQAQADRSWSEIYNLSRTRWVFLGPNSNGGTGVSSLRNYDNSLNYVHLYYMRHGISHDTMMADARSIGVFAPRGPSLYFKTGQVFGPSTDYSHPDCSNIDGGPSYLSQIAHAFMRAAGFRHWPVPAFDQVYWEPTGAYVELWSSQGDITTMRKQRGLGSLPKTYVHWTDAWGFEWAPGVPDLNGGSNLTPIEDALIVSADGSGAAATSGRVRITKPGGGSWAVGDSVTYGLGMGSGVMVNPADFAVNWLCRPMVMVGMVGSDLNQVGAPMRTVAQFARP